MGGWRLIALDMDGTLLDKDGSVSTENRLWIEQARGEGIEVTLATGRPIQYVNRYIEELEIRVPFVVANGSEVWTVDRSLIDRHTFGMEEITFLHGLAVEYNTHFWSSVADHLFKPGTFPADAALYQWLKFGYQCQDHTIIESIWKRLESHGGFEVTSSDKANIEVNPQGISKASGLQKVCKWMGIEARQVVTIGDGLNDVKMLNWAGLGIAMGNAPDQVKDAASWITESNEENGVATAIQYLLNG